MFHNVLLLCRIGRMLGQKHLHLWYFEDTGRLYQILINAIFTLNVWVQVIIFEFLMQKKTPFASLLEHCFWRCSLYADEQLLEHEQRTYGFRNVVCVAINTKGCQKSINVSVADPVIKTLAAKCRFYKHNSLYFLCSSVTNQGHLCQEIKTFLSLFDIKLFFFSPFYLAEQC